MSTAHLTAPAQAGVCDDLAAGVLLCGVRGVHAITSHAARLLDLTDDDLASGARPAGWRLTDDRGVHLPDLPVLAEQVRQSDTAATFALVVAGHRRLLLELSPVPRSQAPLVLAVLRPVHTDLLRAKGLFDPVTDLPNRVLLFDRLDQALRRARVRGTKTTLVLAELTGDDADEAVTDTADRLAGALDEDHTVARYAGDTFAVLGDHPHGSGADLAQRVTTLAPHPVRVGWVTSDGTHSVHDVVARAEQELRT